MPLRAGFDEFLKSQSYADSLKACIWDFAVELPCLRRLGLSNNDLRWLVAAGLVNHAIETTSDSDTVRNFERPARLRFRKRTCFVLTPKGAAVGEAAFRHHFPPAEGLAEIEHSDTPDASSRGHSLTPTWDHDRQELRIGKVIVKRFRVPAPSQEAILEAFQEEAWPPRIDDPLPPHSDQAPKRRLQETIKSLNRNQKRPLVRFLGDGNGQGVLWEYCGDAVPR
jgi:hypothetical protein